MNIVWLCNVPLPEMAKMIGINNYSGGWLIGISSELKKQLDIKLSIIFPQSRIKKLMIKTINGIKYYGIYKKNICEYDTELNMQSTFKKIIKEEKPDVIHIFGTEYPHSLEMIESVDINKTVVSIQGLVSFISNHYLEGIPFYDIIHPTLYGGKIQSLNTEVCQFKKQGRYENDLLRKCKYVIGRTDWDYACVKKMNPNIKYFRCNEIMRETFYENEWDYDKVDRFSVFVSQGNYAVKGLHYLLQAISIIKKRFHKVHVYIAGDLEFISNKYNSPYGVYISKLIRKLNIGENITFIGYHTEKQMCKQYLKSNVVVLCSNIENSPNSIGEAMLLGVPVIASYVGGVPSLIEHNKDGFLYQHNAPYMLAYYIEKIFSDDNLVRVLSENARKKAHALYHKKKNNDKLLHIYRKITDSI